MMSPEKHEFFESLNHLDVTYTDVRTEPGAQDPPAPDIPWNQFFDMPPQTVDITSRLSKNVELKVPIVSSPMDRVTEAPMAIAMAKLGGVGILHYNMSVEAQKDMATKVKLKLNGVIDKPISFLPERTVGEVLQEQAERELDFSTFLVADSENRLVGLLNERKLIIARHNLDRPISDIMIPREQIVAGSDHTTAQQAHDLMDKHDVGMVPLVDETDRIVGLFMLSDVVRTLDENPHNFNLDKQGRLITAIAVPTSRDALLRIEACRKYIDVIVLDTAHGDSPYAFKAYEMIRDVYPDLDIVIGNVSSGKSAKLWGERDVDGIRVGQGAGSICTTRIETGIGIPQVTAIYECAREAEKYDIPVMADGGISNNGDLAVAIAAGAHSVMLGNMLAGTEESPGQASYIDGQKVKEYRGMGSAAAFKDSIHAVDRYTDDPTKKPLPEGVSGHVRYKGPVARIVNEMTAGLKKGLLYSGKLNLEAQRNDTLLRMSTSNGLAESKTHDLL